MLNAKCTFDLNRSAASYTISSVYSKKKIQKHNENNVLREAPPD